MHKLYILLMILILSNSCATLPSSRIPQTISSTNESGMVVGAISFKNEKPIFNSYMLYYTAVGSSKLSEKNMIRINPEQMVKMKFKPDFFDEDKAVYYFSIQQPEGEYSFSKFTVHENGGFIQNFTQIPIDINFSIERGKVRYIGEIYVNYNQASIQMIDKSERDLEKLNNRFPHLKIE